MSPMRRSRTTDVSLGLLAVLVNVAIVVGVIFFTSGRPGPDVPSHASGTPTKSHSGTPKPSAGTRPVTPPAPGDIGSLVAKEGTLTLAVLGDGTGDEEGEWVTVLGQLLGNERKVTVHNLDPSDPTRYNDEIVYGAGSQKATIWNGSRRGAPADYAAMRLDFLVPTKPDAVLLSYGRSDKASNIAKRLDTTLKAVRGKWQDVPVAVILQAQDRDDAIAPVRRAAKEWATSKKLPTIDVADAFKSAGDPNDFVSIVDPPSVNARGGELWGQTVFVALGGKLARTTEATLGQATASAAPVEQQSPWQPLPNPYVPANPQDPPIPPVASDTASATETAGAPEPTVPGTEPGSTDPTDPGGTTGPPPAAITPTWTNTFTPL